MFPIKAVLKINKNFTSKDYINNGLLDNEVNILQNRYQDHLVKLFMIFIKDKKIVVVCSESVIKILKSEFDSNILTYTDLDKYSILNFNEHFINQFEMNITKNSPIPYYYEAVTKAREKANLFFEKCTDNINDYIPIIKLIDYKFNNPVIYILPDALTDNGTYPAFEAPYKILNKQYLDFFENEMLRTLRELNKKILHFDVIEKLTSYGWLPKYKIDAQTNFELYSDILSGKINLAKEVLNYIDEDIYSYLYNLVNPKNPEDPENRTESRGLILLDNQGNIVFYKKDKILSLTPEKENTNFMIQEIPNENDLNISRMELDKNSVLVFSFNGAKDDCIVSK